MASIYGNISNVETTGASQETANQDGPRNPGVSASHELARTDLNRVSQYKGIITKVARAHQIHPAVIAGIISRETRGGSDKVRSNGGWGDHGNAFGLMQVDKRWHTPKGGWDSEEHLIQGTEILVSSIKQIQAKFPSWSKEQQLKGGLAAYNMGASNVQSYPGVDSNTHMKDYSNDVVARAQFYKSNGF
ncbi:hypothetical protein SKAU_G00240020 [Synaphobranchus kaupii]|uniref:Lysozyme g n=1 Tax=Synaphobranchus kaupii TaxID=118154 RepID=A0A9Q1IU93_SYNKA|nr:hypothetical protein SKAU_G00240020 [Synaphobranchus kaupii]